MEGRLGLAQVRQTRIGVAGALMALSVVACLFGAAGNLRFETTPGAHGLVPTLWPTASKIPRIRDRTQMLVFVHPLCGCTTATLNELARVLPQRDVAVNILFFRSPTLTNGKAPSSWDRAVRLPHAQAAWDDAGEEARQFGAETSGFVLLYNRKGELLFHGGITGSRGHEGDNYGLDQLISAIAREHSAPAPSPVFGCSLLNRGIR